MKNVIHILYIAMLMHLSVNGNAQRKWEDIDTTGYFKKEIIRKKGLTLIFINKDSSFNLKTIQRLKDAFWQVYPVQMKKYNPQATKTVTVLISEEYKGVAATMNGVVKIDQQWLTQNPEDIDVITHELMHVVQGYTYAVPDNWLTDGIADYARYTFGVNNEKSGWTLTPFQKGQSYTNSYRIAARFLVWAEKNKCANLVQQLDRALRDGIYHTSIWEKLTGKKLDQLWELYTQNSNI